LFKRFGPEIEEHGSRQAKDWKPRKFKDIKRDVREEDVGY